MCDTVFINPVYNAKYWFTPMNKGVGDITIKLKQALLSNITIIKIDKKIHNTEKM